MPMTIPTNPTPAMKQFHDIKKENPDTILFYRMGDFYEMFYEDAKVASSILEITLTSRAKNSDNPIPMCGIPYHALDGYLARLVKSGKKVAICEQMETPKEAKGVVRREVVRIVTPGTSLSSLVVSEKESSYICSLIPSKNQFGLAYIDLSTSEFRVAEFTNISDLRNELIRIEPRELIIPDDNEAIKAITAAIPMEIQPTITKSEKWVFEPEFALDILLKQFKTESLDGFGCGNMHLAICAAGAALHYLKETQKDPLSHIRSLAIIKTKEHMNLDVVTIKNLELIYRADGVREGSLLDLLDSTVTPMGARALRDWILKPLTDRKQINERQEAVAELHETRSASEKLRGYFSGIRDLERLMGKLSLSAASPRDLVALKNSIETLPEAKSLISSLKATCFANMTDVWDDLSDVRTDIHENITEEPPLTIRDEGIIRDGIHPELDKLRSIRREGKEWISALEVREKEKIGISTLKIKFNNVFGYFIEVSKKDSKLIPEGYIRKQTLVNAERYISPELKEYEETVLGAEDKIRVIEAGLFEEIRLRVASEAQRIIAMGRIVGTVDVLLSLTAVAISNRYTRPDVTNGDGIKIKGGRHPVIERMDNTEKFVPNETTLSSTLEQIMIITGPNMAGKSTYLRQVALIVLMAQMGGFVPAESATIGIIDRIFTRVGAQDFLHRGQSTFMVEMNETSNILNNATDKSLIVLDEIGRGTSTFDGISIAWSVVEYLHDVIKAKTMFATHYHELTELAMSMDRIVNYNVAVREWNEELIFLRKIIQGGADKSYGIQVARLAGLPKGVIQRSREILTNLENKEFDESGASKIAEKRGEHKEQIQPVLPLFSNHKHDELAEEIEQIDSNNMTPMQALIKINELKSLLKK